MGGLLLVDSDQFVLLAVAGLLDDLAVKVGLSPSDLRRLHPLPFQLKKSRWARKRFDESQRRIALDRANGVPAILERPDDDTYEMLVRIEGIDEGEAFLLAHAAADPSCLLTTGDLCALKVLSNEQALANVRARLERKVLPLEVCVRLLLDGVGHPKVSAAFRAVRRCNPKLGVWFSDLNCSDRSACYEAVESDLRLLEQSVDQGILYPWK